MFKQILFTPNVNEKKWKLNKEAPQIFCLERGALFKDKTQREGGKFV